MPAPATVDEFLELVHKSGVADAKRLDAFLQQANANGSLPDDPTALANVLIKEGILTRFQTQQFLLGKWRGFAIGNYKVLERLGSGGMGNVYLCEHKVMRRRVAIKVLATVSAENPESLKRFYREARAAAALDHPHIVRAHDVGREEKLHFLIMDYVDGTSLEEIIRKHGKMDVLRSTHYIRQAAAGLAFAHKAGLIHRDIKPANLMLDRSGTVKVLDMGVARFAEEDEEVLTKGPLGTADYLAPEQARDSHAADYRADIYSLGASFYFMVTGLVPLSEGKTVAQKLLFLQTKEPRPLRELRPEVAEGLAAVIQQMMAKDPDQRYQSLGEVIDALEPWTQTPIAPPPDKEMPMLSLAAMGGEGTDVNLGLTPVAGTSPSGVGMKGPSSGVGMKTPPSSGGGIKPAPAKPPAPAAAAKSKPAAADKPPPSLARVIALSVVVSVVVTIGVVAGIWWLFIRNH